LPGIVGWLLFALPFLASEVSERLIAVLS